MHGVTRVEVRGARPSETLGFSSFEELDAWLVGNAGRVARMTYTAQHENPLEKPFTIVIDQDTEATMNVSGDGKLEIVAEGVSARRAIARGLQLYARAVRKVDILVVLAQVCAGMRFYALQELDEWLSRNPRIGIRELNFTTASYGHRRHWACYGRDTGTLTDDTRELRIFAKGANIRDTLTTALDWYEREAPS